MKKNIEKNRTEKVALNKPKISLQECKAILNRDREEYSDEEVIEIRDFLYALIEIDYFHFQKHMAAKEKQREQNETEAKIIQLKSSDETNNSFDAEPLRKAS